MENKKERFGTFSSSNIWKLMTLATNKKDFGAPALKYIKQVALEIKLGRYLNKEVSAKSTDWGNMLEGRVNELLPLDYQLVSKERLFHKEIKHYSGAPDLIKPLTVADCKCPFSLEVFCDKIDSFEDLGFYKKEFPEDYWQLISNAILLESNGFEVKYIEPIIYVPYFSELKEIKENSLNFFDKKYNWVLNAEDCELPYLKDNGYYKNLNVIKFSIPQADKDFLTNRVVAALELINKK